MYCLTTIDMQPAGELENELRYFFRRIRAVKRRLQQEQGRLFLNRLQRIRCKANLLKIEMMEDEFHAISYREDIREIYRKLQRYVKLDHERLMHTFGTETVSHTSLYVKL